VAVEEVDTADRAAVLTVAAPVVAAVVVPEAVAGWVVADSAAVEAPDASAEGKRNQAL